jgi:hypothetical protein
MRLRHILSGLPLLLLLAPGSAPAQQQGQEWFIPGQGQGQRPPAAAQPPAQQRPPAAPAQGQQQQQQQRPAAGQRPPAPVLAMVDVPEVNRLSAAFNQVREELERRRARLNEDLQREQGRWREEQQALAAARDAGADMNQLAKDMEGPEVSATLQESARLADALSLSGTPTYVLGDEVVVGAVGYAQLKARLDNVRKCGKTNCG